MSKEERVDEIAPLIAGVARIGAGVLRTSGSVVKSLAKKKAFKKAKEKLIGKKNDPQVDQALDQEMREALHTAYKNLIMEMMKGPDGKGLSPQEVAAAKERVDSKKAGGGAPSPNPSPNRSPTTKERPKPSRVRSALAGVTLNGLTAAERAKEMAGNAVGRAANSIQKFRADRAAAKQIRGDNRDKKRAENQAAKETAKGQRGIKREKARVRAEKAAAASKEAAEIQNQSQRGTKQTITGRFVDRAKDDLVSATYSAATGRGIGRGRAAMKARRERIQFQHTEYHRIGSILAERSAAWTRKAGKNPSGGLNAKGVASYRAKNPGSKLKTAVTTKPSKLKKGSKAAKRRSSFCSRMSGMRKRQNPKNNTGKDRLSLSLKKWNC